MRKNEGSMQIYRDSPWELRIDPTYFPCPHRYSWEDFARVQARFPLALNYPNLPNPEHFIELTEEWMIRVCSEQLQLYSGVLDYTITMFKIFLHLIQTCLTQFDELALVDHSFHHFHFGDHRLAFDFNVGPLPQQMHGYFARIQFLHSSYHRTFEEMVTYNFIENYFSSCFGPNATHQEHFLATRIEEVDCPLPPPPPAMPHDARRQQEIEKEIQAITLRR